MASKTETTPVKSDEVVKSDSTPAGDVKKERKPRRYLGRRKMSEDDIMAIARFYMSGQTDAKVLAAATGMKARSIEKYHAQLIAEGMILPPLPPKVKPPRASEMIHSTMAKLSLSAKK